MSCRSPLDRGYVIKSKDKGKLVPTNNYLKLKEEINMKKVLAVLCLLGIIPGGLMLFWKKKFKSYI